MEYKFDNKEQIMVQDIIASYITNDGSYSGKYQTSLILNKNKESNFAAALSKELYDCEEFMFNVAFITDDGLIMLKHSLDEASSRNIKGRIITSDYLMFNSPKTFEELLKLEKIGIEIRIFSGNNFHAKGYIFKSKDEYRTIVGSSNMTANAMKVNMEWNICVSSMKNGSFVKQIIEEFEDEWNYHTVRLTQTWIDKYKERYVVRKTFEENPIYETYNKEIKPNAMQIEALANLKLLRENHENRALLISATGTGKTYLSAFDAREFKPKKLLFIAHRGKLLTDAKKTFKKVFGNQEKYGIFKGTRKDTEERFVFASIQTLSKEENLRLFEKDEFDYIVIDEAHHTPTKTYVDVLNYFNSKFILGMTATPERTDGFNVFEYYNHVIAYEIRLNQALDYDLLCPFHYFGISDLTIGNKSIDDKTHFNLLTCDERVNFVMEKANYYGYSGERVKGLIFVNRIEVAKELSIKFNERGWKTRVISGENSEDEREKTIRLLENDCPSQIDYIISVDVLNEGVDIPEVNQIIMLRPTQSAIVFIQQLGRGLRKTEEKKYVNVLDFIGNYEKNFLIPIALSGNKSQNREDYRKFLVDAPVITPGITTIEFDSVVKDRIFKSINTKASFKKEIYDEYKNLKNMLGRIPNYQDFLKYDTIDLNVIVEEYNSYHNFLVNKEKEYNDPYIDDETYSNYIDYISKEFINGKRLNEIKCIDNILKNKPLDFSDTVRDKCVEKYLNGYFLSLDDKKRYGSKRILDENGCPNNIFVECLKNVDFRQEIREIIEYAKEVNKIKFQNKYKDTDLVLYEKYTRKDVCRLLNWDKNLNPQNIGGYFYDENSKTMAVYVTYNKVLTEKTKNIMYEDRFIDQSNICCISKNCRTHKSPELKRLMGQKDNGIKVHMFINKVKHETDFYYLGEVEYVKSKETKNENKQNIVEINYKFLNPVKESIYEYLITKIEDQNENNKSSSRNN